MTEEYVKRIQEEDKKILINLWLPLALDIQGLSEVQNDFKKAQKYFDEVRKELVDNGKETTYCESLKLFPNIKEEEVDDEIPEWNEIKEELQNCYKDFDPTEVVNQIAQNEDYSKFNNKYFSDPKFLPNWLQEVVRVIDKKIGDSNPDNVKVNE